MKYISVLIFVLCMIVTWSLSQNGSTADLQQHKEIEASLEGFIRSAIQRQIPNVKDIVFRQLYTETVRPGEEMKAHFRYELVAPTKAGDTTAQTVQGSVTLKSSDHGGNWTIVNEQVSSPNLRFEEGVHITPTTSAEEDAAAVEHQKNHMEAVPTAPEDQPASRSEHK